MPHFFYQIKGKDAQGSWQWPPLFSNKIEATDSKQARKLLEEEYGMKLPGGRLKKEADAQQVLVVIEDMTDRPWLIERFEIKTCDQCQRQYRLIDKYTLREGGARNFCSQECGDNWKREFSIPTSDINYDFKGIHDPVIYKITNKATGKAYIGKTTQAFTLRWYQHFFQSAPGTKFYNAVRESVMSDWLFEVLEVVATRQHQAILERESYWINKFNTIKEGYNSVISKVEEIEEDKSQLVLFGEEASIPEVERSVATGGDR